MNVFITGGCGFIGSHLAERLLERGDAVTVLDDLSTGSMDNTQAAINSFQRVAPSNSTKLRTPSVIVRIRSDSVTISGQNRSL